MSSTIDSIKVVARFRPPNKIEQANGGQPIVGFESDDTCNVNGSGNFTFDRIFDTKSQQCDVFDFSIRSTVDDILNGYNGTVFAYGQTGAGKSYTMMGSDIDDRAGRGIIPRIVEHIFASIMSSPGNIEYTVRVSYMEIYMERIRDLMAPQNDNLPIHEEKGRGVYVKGLHEIYVSSVAEVYEVMRRGGLARATAATNMNQESSRSHSMFQIIVNQKDVESGSAKAGVLFLVDLAGSEKVGKTGASGQTLEEAKKINKSLSALGMVINSLTDGKSTHIPYRDSKLTRILQESLGGNAKTTLIINCSPSSFNAEETLSTLRFGVRAKKIHNKAKINAELSPEQLKALLKRAQTQVTTFEDYLSTLEGEVSLWRNGDRVPRERWTPARSFQAGLSKGRPEVRALPPTPSRSTSTDSRRPESLIRPDSRFEIERSSTPSTISDRDEREEFLRRENELVDQLTEKESQLAKAEAELAALRLEVPNLIQQQKDAAIEHDQLQNRLHDLQVQSEKLHFEQKEVIITTDGLKEANAELTSELDETKQRLLDATIKLSENNASSEQKERKREEKMAVMMAEFGSSHAGISSQEYARVVHDLKGDLLALLGIHKRGEAIVARDFDSLLGYVDELEESWRGAGLNKPDDQAELQQRLSLLESEFANILRGSPDEDNAADVEDQLADIYNNATNSGVENVHEKLSKVIGDNVRLRRDLEVQRQRSEILVNDGGAGDSNNLQRQAMDDFDGMKTRLMRDLTNRCERVVELEISLDEAREQYENVLRASSAKAQSTKMTFLEKSLEQLTSVQKQLVDQNQTLKKEVAIAGRKLEARNERISNLERTLNQSYKDLNSANQRYVLNLCVGETFHAKFCCCSLESQVNALKERIETGTRNGGRVALSPANGNIGPSLFGTSIGGSRIAKPLRGGGGEGTSIPVLPTMANLQAAQSGRNWLSFSRGGLSPS